MTDWKLGMNCPKCDGTGTFSNTGKNCFDCFNAKVYTEKTIPYIIAKAKDWISRQSVDSVKVDITKAHIVKLHALSTTTTERQAMLDELGYTASDNPELKTMERLAAEKGKKVTVIIE